MKRLLFLIVVLIGISQPLRAASPCCGVIAVNVRTGTVTAKENSTGRTFEFHVANAKLLAGLRVGSAVYANFSNKQVSLDGKTACCAITKINTAPPRGGVGAGLASPTAAAAAPAGPAPAPGTAPPPPASANPSSGSAQGAKAGQQKPTTQQSSSSSNTDKPITDTSQITASEPNDTAMAIRGASATPPAAGPAPCCTVISVDMRTGVMSAREESSGRTFEVKSDNPRLMDQIRPGQGIYANFKTNQASLDGKTACCKILAESSPEAGRGIVGAAGAATNPAAVEQGMRPNGAPLGPPNGATGAAPAASTAGAARPGGTGLMQPNGATGAQSSKPLAGEMHGAQALHGFTLPVVTAGAPQRVDSTGPQMRTPGKLQARSSGVNSHVLRVRGMAGIQQATSLPEGARELLLMHARTLGAGELDDYIVNTQLAEEWMKTHPAPASAKAATSGDKHTGCKAISIHCAEEAGQHAVDETSRQSEKFLKQARDEWKHVTDEATHDWHMTEGCFADHTLTLPNIPVQFSVVPQISLDAEKSGSASNKYGSASGNVKGTVSFGIPLDADFQAQLDLFYIPCLPFAVRPRSLGADGSLVSGSRLGATLTATGKFNQHFMIPPSGGPHFPIEIIPIVIAGVPVAELDVSVYVDGTLDIDGDGRLDSNFSLEVSQKTNFDFSCSGNGCRLRSHTAPLPKTASEAVKIQGRVHVKPAVYVALQLDFDEDILSARAGPQPYLLGELYGCGAASATQTQGGPSTAQEFYALTADLDWGIELRSEALVTNKIVAEAPRIQLVPANKKHLYFKDLAASTALVPLLNGTLQPSAGHSASYKTKMPACYPYSDPVEYQVNWTGGATATDASTSTAATNSRPKSGALTILPGSKAQPASSSAPSACTLLAGQGDCWSDPLKDVSLDLVWPVAGTYTLSVVPVRDKHGRRFMPETSTKLDITVQQ
jgi:hypothetical protein